MVVWEVTLVVSLLLVHLGPTVLRVQMVLAVAVVAVALLKKVLSVIMDQVRLVAAAAAVAAAEKLVLEELLEGLLLVSTST